MIVGATYHQIDAALIKPIIEQIAHLRRTAQRHQTLPDIARWQHAQFVAQLSSRAAVVNHINQRRNTMRVLFQTRQQRKTPGSAADYYNFYPKIIAI